MLTQEQLEQRLNFITGSDCGVICGVNEYQTAVELWQYKTRRAIPKDISDKPAIIAGNMLESAVANWFTHATGKQLIQDNKFHVHKSIPFLGGNVDRFVVGENAILECKTTQSDKGWGLGWEAYDNQIPDNYLCQVIHYLAVTGCSIAYIAVLIRGVDFRWFKYVRDDSIEKQILDMEIKFWNEHIVADVCPEPITADEVQLFLRGAVSDEAIVADEDILDAINGLRNCRASMKDLEEVEKQFKDKIAVYMGDKQTLLDANGRIAVTWKQREGSIRFDAKAFKLKNPDLYSQFEIQGEPVRTFLLK